MKYLILTEKYGKLKLDSYSHQILKTQYDFGLSLQKKTDIVKCQDMN